MKKLFALLMALCMLCAACTALADMQIPTWDSMPLVADKEDGAVSEADFEGEWVLKVAFADGVYVDEATLFDVYDFNFMPYIIGDGLMKQDRQQANGEFITLEMPYTLVSGQLQGVDTSARLFAVELLEDGNIVLSVFYPGEAEKQVCLSIFLVHPEVEEEQTEAE